MPIDRQKIIEEAQKKGIDMSWLQQAGQAPQVQATGGLERLSPGAAELMEGVRQTQQRSAPYIPFPQGAPTQRRTEMELGAEQWDQDFERGILEADRAYERGILEADRNYQLQREELELKRAAEMAGQAGGAEGEAGSAIPDWMTPTQSGEYMKTQGRQLIKAEVKELLAEGARWEDIEAAVKDPLYESAYAQYALGPDEILQAAAEAVQEMGGTVPPQYPNLATHAPGGDFLGGMQDWAARAGDIHRAGQLLDQPAEEAGSVLDTSYSPDDLFGTGATETEDRESLLKRAARWGATNIPGLSHAYDWGQSQAEKRR